MTDTSNTSPTTGPTTNITPQEALELLRDELAAMEEPDILRKPGLDPAMATTIAVGSLGRITKHRGEIVARFGDEAARAFDELPAVAMATMQANSNFAASDSATDLSAKFEKIAKDHALLLADADALVQRGLLDRTRVDQGRPCQGYRTTLSSIFVLLSIFRERFAAIADVTPVTLDELKQIEKDALLMSQLLDEREVGATRLPAAEMRARAVSKLIRTYGEVRRLITFVRWWSEDADEIAPSLWSGRRGKSRNGAEPVNGQPAAPDSPVAPVAPVVAGPNNGGGPFTS